MHQFKVYCQAGDWKASQSCFESCSMFGKTITWNFRTRTHIHTHTHALRGAHTHGHTYMHRHTYTHTHTLFKKWWHQGTWSLSTFSISSNDLNKDELNTSEHNCRRRHADRLEPLGLRKDAWKAQEVFVVSQETVTVVICCHVVEHCKFYELVAVITRQLS